MQFLYLSLFRPQLHLGLLIVAIFVVLELGHVELECLDLLHLQGYADVRLVALLLLGLEGEAVLAQLLAHRTILLQHDLLVLRELAKLLLRLRTCLIEDPLEVYPGLLAGPQVFLHCGIVFTDVLEKEQFF